MVDRLEYYEAGETVELEVYRAQDGEYNAQKISVTLGAKKDAPSTNSSSNQQQNEKIINSKKRYQNTRRNVVCSCGIFLISSKKSQMPYHANMKVI